MHCLGIRTQPKIMDVDPEAIEQYDLYCLVDRLFYDAPHAGETGEPDFTVVGRRFPEGWVHHADETWLYFAPPMAPTPQQGWKIHVSSSLPDADRTLETVWDYCVSRGIPFKYLRSRPVMIMLNSKAAFRGSSGKLVTIYPADDAQLQTILEELDALLDGVQGPYILSDLRYGKGPLFVRYGGFMERYCLSDTGTRVLALENADGELVPDVRGPVFALPDWATMPEFLQPHLAARNSVSVEDIPYQVESAVHFSNGGGVYLAKDKRTDKHVVLKEARPHAGLDAIGRDAVARLLHERDILERLAGLDVVPGLLDYFQLGDHHFLVLEHIDGSPLQRLIVNKYPLTHPDPPKDELARYTQWALGMMERVEQAIAAFHERGVVFGDLHPDNILVSVDDRMVLIDFEVSTLVEDESRSTLAHPGFQPPAERTGADADRYALACMHLHLFAPQTTVQLNMNLAKAAQLGSVVGDVFPTPDQAKATTRAVDTVLGRHKKERTSFDEVPMPGAAPWVELRDALRTAIVASATPERTDRLFPGDPMQFFPGGGINLATGAAGVLFALDATGAGRFPEYEDWLLKHAVEPAADTPAGFYDGLHGVAFVLDQLGHRQEALDIVERSLALLDDNLELGLRSGLAGIGLNLMHLGDRAGESKLLDLADRIVAVTADRLGEPMDVPEISGGGFARAGLMYGSSGLALLFVRAYERTGDSALLDHATTAIYQDLRRCIRGEDGTLQVNQGWRTLPYLDEGSAGIAIALARYLRHRRDEDLTADLRDLSAVARAGYFVQSGLFAGRASMLAMVGALRRGGFLPDGDDSADLLIRGLRWHAMTHAGGLAFPGDQLLRLSMDFATGTAGVLFALGTVEHSAPVYLPFFGPPGTGGRSEYPSND